MDWRYRNPFEHWRYRNPFEQELHRQRSFADQQQDAIDKYWYSLGVKLASEVVRQLLLDPRNREEIVQASKVSVDQAAAGSLHNKQLIARGFKDQMTKLGVKAE